MSHGDLVRRAQAAAAVMPYQSFSTSQLLAIEKAIRLVWDESIAIQKLWEKDFDSCKEVEISTILIETFAILQTDTSEGRESPLAGFFSHFQIVTPDASLRDYQRKALQKRPDFSFRSTEIPKAGINPYFWALFAEAKVISQKRTIADYVNNGLAKFVRGEYGWAMSQGMMLCYLQDTDQSLPKALNEHLNRHGKRELHLVEKFAEPVPWSRTHMRVHQTVHGRKWRYLETEKEPGSIAIFHLWLEVPAPKRT